MPEESRMSIVTGDAGGQGHVGTMTSRGEAGGKQEGSRREAVSSTPSVTRHTKNAKKSEVRHRKHHPPIEKKITFLCRAARV